MTEVYDMQIVVTGSRMAASSPVMFYSAKSRFNLDEPIEGGEGGGGSVPENPPEVSHTETSECATGVAEQVADKIRTLVNPDQPREYGAIIVRNSNGQYGVYEGIHSDGVDRATLSAPEEIRTSVAGIVHNHPFNAADSRNLRLENRYPSDGDWGALTALADGGANPNNLSMYIMDSSGILREFKYSQKGFFLGMSSQDRTTAFGLPAETDGCPS